MRIRLRIGNHAVPVMLADNGTARDFATLLPLTLRMADLFEREKYGRLPRPLSAEGPRERSYAVGQLVYWSPGPDVAVFYRHDGQAVPSPGTIVLGTVGSGIEHLDVPGSVTLTMERDE